VTRSAWRVRFRIGLLRCRSPQANWGTVNRAYYRGRREGKSQPLQILQVNAAPMARKNVGGAFAVASFQPVLPGVRDEACDAFLLPAPISGKEYGGFEAIFPAAVS
jgi:hypothetical protein